MEFILTIPAAPVAFVFSIANTTMGGGAGGTINVYVDGALEQTETSSDLDAETVNVIWQ